MTLSEDISTISTSLSDIKDAIILKGVIPSGNITTYATAIGQISSSSGYIPREVKNGVYQQVSESFTFSLPSTATDLDYQVLRYAFFQSAGLTSVDLSSLTAVSNSGSLSDAFDGCINLTSADLSSLVTVSGENSLSYAFAHCTSLTSVDLSSLVTVSGSRAFNCVFYDCPSLTSINLPNLASINSYNMLYEAFKDCTSLTSLSFPSLTSTSFGSYQNQFYNMLSGVTGCTVHFPSNLQSVISNWSSVTSGFGGTNTTVLFDLTATT